MTIDSFEQRSGSSRFSIEQIESETEDGNIAKSEDNDRLTDAPHSDTVGIKVCTAESFISELG